MAKGVLITGASGGIGQACAHWFAERGWQVFLHGRDETRLISLHDELKANYQIDCYYSRLTNHLKSIRYRSTI